MLTLSRKVGERITIGGNIIVVVKEIKGGTVRLGIEAPKEIGIFREELIQDPTTPAFKKRRPGSEG